MPVFADAAVRETHLSVLFFVRDRVYKWRKPVRFDFVDFTSRAAREVDCQREVALNSRYSPDVYLGVLDLVERGTAIDHLVVMRRLPEERRLAALLGTGRDLEGEIRSIARLVAEVDAHSERGPELDEFATRDAERLRWHTNFAEVEPFVGTTLDSDAEARLEALVERFLAGREPLFRARIAAGAVRDGHGDLQAEDIFCLPDGPRILDCVEFDDRLRYGDVLTDLSFLAMDLTRLGAGELAEVLYASYEELTGDHLPRVLADHYSAGRAFVRSKVACLAEREGVPGARELATELQRLTLEYLERSRVRLVVLGGAPGSGKSTLAAGLGEVLGAVVLRSDEVRQELSRAQGIGALADRYRPLVTAETYRLLLARAEIALGLGESVVLDASWSSEPLREAARTLAVSASADLVQLCCSVPGEVAARRIRTRPRDDPSEVTVEVAREISANAAPWPSATVIDTSGWVADTLRRALGALGIAPPGPSGQGRAVPRRLP